MTTILKPVDSKNSRTVDVHPMMMFLYDLPNVLQDMLQAYLINPAFYMYIIKAIHGKTWSFREAFFVFNTVSPFKDEKS